MNRKLNLINGTEIEGAYISQSINTRILTSKNGKKLARNSYNFNNNNNPKGLTSRNTELPSKFNITTPNDRIGGNLKNKNDSKNNHNRDKIQRNECFLFTKDIKMKRKKSLSICEYKAKLSHSNSPSSKMNDLNIQSNQSPHKNKNIHNFYIEAKQVMQNPRKISKNSPNLVKIRKSLTDKKQNIEIMSTISATKESQSIQASKEIEQKSENDILSSNIDSNINYNPNYLDPIRKIYIKRKNVNENKSNKRIKETSCLLQNSKILKSFHLYNQDVIFLKSFK